MALALYSTAYWLFMGVSCALYFAGALLLWLVTLPFDRNRRLLHLYSCLWAQTEFQVNPLWRLRIDGRNKLPWRGPAVIVSNHQSLGDILVLFGLFRPYKWVSKASIFKVPFIGWNMRLNDYVGLVRGDRESIVRMMDTCRKWLSRGVPVLMFPEGTRSPDGQVRDFKDGAFRLAAEQNVPLIPIALTGSADTLPKHGFKVALRSDCRVRVLDPILPADFGNSPERLRDEARARIIAAKQELDREREHAGFAVRPPRTA
jgi:1-acyl-sn-glycerol-3-phosphate acyltransferase